MWLLLRLLGLLLLEHCVRSLGRNAPLDKLTPGRLAPAQPLARLGLDGAARAPVRRTLHAATAATLAAAARLTALLLCWLKVVPVFVSRAALTAPKVRRALHCAGQSVTPTKIHVKRKPNKQKVKKDGGKKWENSSRERKKWEKKVSELFLRRKEQWIQSAQNRNEQWNTCARDVQSATLVQHLFLLMFVDSESFFSLFPFGDDNENP